MHQVELLIVLVCCDFVSLSDVRGGELDGLGTLSDVPGDARILQVRVRTDLPGAGMLTKFTGAASQLEKVKSSSEFLENSRSGT